MDEIYYNREAWDKSRPFYLVSTDKDGSGEDIYGWHFKGVEPKYKDVEILIIND